MMFAKGVVESRFAGGMRTGVLMVALALLAPVGGLAAESPPEAPPADQAPEVHQLPATVPASVPATVPASAPANIPASAPANIPASVPATVPATVPASVPSRLPAEPVVSLVAPPSEKAPDRVLSPGDVDLQVNRNLGEDAETEERLGDDFFANASVEVEKGKGGMFAGITNPIEKFIRYFQTRGRDRFGLYLSRSGKYAELMRGILSKYGLPEDLIYLALIESGFSPKAYSVAKAAGPWQFIAGTGRRYGLRIDWWADERRDAEKSTHAAASYLKDLYGMFESWPLAAAAYNAGEGKIQRAVTRYRSEDYAELIRYRYLKQETKDYVPKMLAALTIAKEPEKYGFGDVQYEAPLDLRTVVVPGGTDLGALSRILEVPYEALREWNPELRRFCTPPNRERYDLRLSPDAARLAEERMVDIRTQAKVTFIQHTVRKGETLQGLAGKYETSPEVLKELNGLKRDTLSRTSRLVIPVTGLSDEEAVPGKELSPDQLTMAHLRVEEEGRKGKSGKGRRAVPGESVTARKGAPAPAAAKKGTAAKRPPEGGKRTVQYKVHKGDTLERIARVYGVKPARLAERNGLKPGEPLRLGVVLVIPLES